MLNARRPSFAIHGLGLGNDQMSSQLDIHELIAAMSSQAKSHKYCIFHVE